MARPRGGAMARLQEDSGVVAIIVALSMSTFLLGFAALAVDLGIAYTRKAQLQSAADRLALAAAQALPATTGSNTDGSPGAEATFRTQWARICQGEDDADVWPATLCPDAGWAFDNNPDNGQIQFVNDSDGGMTYTLPAAMGASPASATAVRVELPPSTVQYGFGAVFGTSSADVQKAASARIGTPLGAGILPIPVTTGDLKNGQLCVADPSVPPKSGIVKTPPTPTTRPSAMAVDVDPTIVPYNDDADPTSTIKVTVRMSVPLRVTAFRNLTVFNGASLTGMAIDSGDVSGPLPDPKRFGNVLYSFQTEVPWQPPTTNLAVWVTGDQFASSFRRGRFGQYWYPFTSSAGSLRFDGPPAPDLDPCDLSQASTRGYTPMFRTDSATALDQLESNLRVGPQSQLYPPAVLTALLGPITDACLTARPAKPVTACLTQDATPGYSGALRDGLLTSGDGQPGRLVGDCGNGTTSSNGYSGIDASRLVNASSNLVNPAFGSGNALRGAIISQATPRQGWVTAKALACPRMAVLPVLNDATLPLPAGGRTITGFVYFWIDGITADRGLQWGTGGRLHSVSGYIVDPKYLPSVVAGSRVVGPYLGDSMPKEATLICDLGDREQGRCG